MTKIDEATGMAALPEDMFWKVEQESIGYGYGATSVDTVSISLCQTYTDVERAFTRTRQVKASGLRGFFGGTKIIDEEVPEKVETYTRTLTSGSLLEKRNEKPKDSMGWKAKTIQSGWDSYKAYYRITPCTKDTLRELSIKTWNEYLDTRHEVALRMNSERDLKKFLGSYPPKSLNLVEA